MQLTGGKGILCRRQRRRRRAKALSFATFPNRAWLGVRTFHGIFFAQTVTLLFCSISRPRATSLTLIRKLEIRCLLCSVRHMGPHSVRHTCTNCICSRHIIQDFHRFPFGVDKQKKTAASRVIPVIHCRKSRNGHHGHWLLAILRLLWTVLEKKGCSSLCLD